MIYGGLLKEIVKYPNKSYIKKAGTLAFQPKYIPGQLYGEANPSFV